MKLGILFHLIINRGSRASLIYGSTSNIQILALLLGIVLMVIYGKLLIMDAMSASVGLISMLLEVSSGTQTCEGILFDNLLSAWNNVTIILLWALVHCRYIELIEWVSWFVKVESVVQWQVLQILKTFHLLLF